MPSEARTPCVGRYFVGWPGTASQVRPPSLLRKRFSRSMSDTPAYSVELALPAAPLRGSKTTNTMPLPPRGTQAG